MTEDDGNVQRSDDDDDFEFPAALLNHEEETKKIKTFRQNINRNPSRAVDGDDEVTQFLQRMSTAQMPKFETRDDETTDFRYDRYNDDFIHIESGAIISQKSVDERIPKEFWRQENAVHPDGAPMLVRRRNSDDVMETVQQVAQIPPSKDLKTTRFNLFVNGRSWIPGAEKLAGGWGVRDGNLVPMNGKLYNYYNAPPPILPEWEGDTAPWDNIMSGFNDDDRNDLLDEFAYNVQHPGKKISGIAVITSETRHGKDSLLLPLAMYFDENAKNITVEDVVDRYNPWVRNCVVFVNETSSKDHNAMAFYEALKGVSTTPPNTILYHNKNEKKFPIINAVTIYVTTNHPHALRFDSDDKRIKLRRLDNSHLDLSEQFWKDYHKWLADGGWKAVIFKLSRRDISKFNPSAHARMSEIKLAVIESNKASKRNVLDIAIDEFIESQAEIVKAAARVKHRESGSDEPFAYDDDDLAATLPRLLPRVILARQLRAFIDSAAASDFQTELPDNALEKWDRLMNQLPHKMREFGYAYYGDLKCRVDAKPVKISGVYYEASLCNGISDKDKQRDVLKDDVIKAYSVHSKLIKEVDHSKRRVDGAEDKADKTSDDPF